MRVLVYPHDLGMGGSQTNAIEIAAQIRDLGVEPIIFGRSGALEKRIAELGLELVESPDPGRRPSARIALRLRQIARSRRIDVFHGYEWPPALECSAAAATLPRTAAVSTVMSMSVPPFLPRTVPLVVGTRQIAAAEREAGRSEVFVIEPPVDLRHNLLSSAQQVEELRRRWGLDEDRPLVVCVGRLADQLKSEGLLTAIEALGSGPLAGTAQLLVVGDGPARDRIEQAAARSNALHPGSVVLTGQLDDPRPAYSAADVVLGMGGSALRALALGKPLIVQGERGFFEVFDEKSWPAFRWQGFYGVGSAVSEGSRRLVDCLQQVLADPTATVAATRFGREVVRERFSLESAAEAQLAVYEHALRSKPAPATRAGGLVASGRGFARYYVRRKLSARLGVAPADDFNAHPVAASAAGSNGRAEGHVVYLSGSSWHGVAGSDVSLATALAVDRPVLWVDPPMSAIGRRRRGLQIPFVSDVAPGITRIHPTALPGVSRPVVRSLSRMAAHRQVEAFVWATGVGVDAVIASSPEPLLRAWRRRAVMRVYYATDDFVSGARLLGLSMRRAQRARTSNVSAAHVALAVSEPLAAALGPTRAEVVLFPNACSPERYERPHDVDALDLFAARRPRAGMVGQINERLDLAYLESVADQELGLVLVGPRYEQPGAFSERLDRLLARDNVEWVDRLPASEMPAVMRSLDVGLTPYRDTAFNRASSPLKTLDYLAAGLPVVSTDLPAARALDPEVVRVGSSPQEFADAVIELLGDTTSSLSGRCREFAADHSWSARARQLQALIRPAP